MTKPRHYTQLEFGSGYDCDSGTQTVVIRIGNNWDHGDASVTLKGDDLDMVTAAFFHLRGYTVTPGIKQFGLRRYKNYSTTTVTDDRTSLIKGALLVFGPLAYSLSIDDARSGDLRLWIQSTCNSEMWLNIMMNKKAADEFGRLLAEAAEWDITDAA